MEKQDITSKFIEYIEGTKDFLSDNIPSFFNEVITFNLIKNILGGFFSLILIPVFIVMFWKASSDDENNEMRNFIIFIGSILGLVITIIVVILSLESIIKILWAPKLYLLDYFLNQK